MIPTSLIYALCLGVAAAAPADERALFDKTYDYVIVGGGTGGLALAARLSENPAMQVAVIEAVTYYQVSNIIIGSTPAAASLFAGADPKDTNPLVDWSFVTAPQAGADNREVHYARGKCLGGSSARNFMVYHRPDAGSLQAWADAVGDDSYTFDQFVPYFRKSVSFTPPNNDLRAANASVTYDASAFDAAGGGPVQVTYPNYGSPWSTWLQTGLSAIGLADTADFNRGKLEGHNYCTCMIDPKSMKRSSSQTAYLDQANGRPNLHVHQLTMAKKILFDGNKRATGVQIRTGATLFARREVIVSAGAFQSPQLLMVSGVGPAAALTALGIQVVADRPGVGQNMTDHVFVSPSYRVRVDTFTKIAVSVVRMLWEFTTNFTLFKKGPLTDPIASYLGWEKVPAQLLPAQAAADLASLPATWPTIEYLAAPGYIGDFKNLLKIQPKDGYQYASILTALAAPMSRGSVSLRSANMDDHPIIDPRWLTHPTDQAVLVAGYKRTRAIFNSDALKPVLADPNEYFPGAEVDTDAEILDTIRKTLMTVWHASVTCRMGRVDDPTAVVDNKARVIGVEGLRVVDASAFALLPPGHPTSVVYALAEKIADDIKAGW